MWFIYFINLNLVVMLNLIPSCRLTDIRIGVEKGKIGIVKPLSSGKDNSCSKSYDKAADILLSGLCR